MVLGVKSKEFSRQIKDAEDLGWNKAVITAFKHFLHTFQQGTHLCSFFWTNSWVLLRNLYCPHQHGWRAAQGPRGAGLCDTSWWPNVHLVQLFILLYILTHSALLIHKQVELLNLEDCSETYLAFSTTERVTPLSQLKKQMPVWLLWVGITMFIVCGSMETALLVNCLTES